MVRVRSEKHFLGELIEVKSARKGDGLSGRRKGVYSVVQSGLEERQTLQRQAWW